MRSFIHCTYLQILLGRSNQGKCGGSMGVEIKVCSVLVGKPRGKRLVERPRRRWEDGIRMDLRGNRGRVDPAGSGYGPVAGFCKYGDEPSGSGAAELICMQARAHVLVEIQ
jgi:hypothetical protein